jgi:hypothetical protein
MQTLLPAGKHLRSPGGSFFYEVQGPCCQLYDREQLPWPSCSLSWRGKQPSWKRIGPRFVPDMAARRCPTEAVKAVDQWGNEWEQVLTLYHDRMGIDLQRWWYTRYTPGKPFPELP